MNISKDMSDNALSTDSDNDFTDNIIKIDKKMVKEHLGQLVKGSVEETLNALLDEEADRLCGAKHYERSEERKDYRCGKRDRKLHTTAGTVNLKVPKLRTLPFESAIIERYKRRESSVEEALIEMYLAGVSVRRVEDITEALWGEKVSAGTVSNLNKKAYERIDEWRNKPITGNHPYLSLDGMWFKRCWGNEVKNVAVLIAVGVDEHGYREVLGTVEGCKEDKESWLSFLKHLKDRGLQCPEIVTSDKCLGLIEAIAEVFPEANWQRCTVHWYRNILKDVPKSKVREVSAMLKAIHSQEDKEAALQKSDLVVEKLHKMKLRKASERVRESALETLSYMDYPRSHWKKLRTNNPLERLIREVRRRTRVVGAFPDGNSALMLVAARLRHVASTKWGVKRYMNMGELYEQQKERRLREEIGSVG